MRAAAYADKVHDTVSQKPKATLLERAVKIMRRLSGPERETVLQHAEQEAAAAVQLGAHNAERVTAG